MPQLGELLELLHHGGAELRTVRAEVRTWEHRERGLAALRRHVGESAAARSVAVMSQLDVPESSERRTRLWIEFPDRVREEREESSGQMSIGVRVGSRWWHYSPGMGAMSNEQNPEVGSGVGEEYEYLFDPWRLVSALALEPVGEATVAGRPAWRARARARKERPGSDHLAVFRLGPGADDYELSVDREHGVLLRVASNVDGEPFRVVEMAETVFNEQLPSETFVFEPPAGAEIKSPYEIPRHRELRTLAELAEAAPFTVFAPPNVPEGWRIEIGFIEPGPDRAAPAQAYISFHRRDGQAWLSLREQAADAPVFPLDSEDAPEAWRTERRGDRDVLIRQVTADWPTRAVRLTLEGTHIEVVSPQLDVEDLAALAEGLAAVPPEPPRFTQR